MSRFPLKQNVPGKPQKLAPVGPDRDTVDRVVGAAETGVSNAAVVEAGGGEDGSMLMLGSATVIVGVVDIVSHSETCASATEFAEAILALQDA